MNQYLEELKKIEYKKLENYGFKEIDVREEIVMPLLKALGYNFTGDFKIIREKKLINPFNMVGTKKYPINIFPDYILECKGKCCCIIEVKSPSKTLKKEEYIGQAYSYAVHREVQAEFYALCNGKSFILYRTNLLRPILEFDLEEIEIYFDYLNKFIGINSIEKNEAENKNRIVKDLGIHLKMISSSEVEHRFYFSNFLIDSIMLIDNNTYCITENTLLEGDEYCGTFDFNSEKLLKLKPYLKEKEFEELNRVFDGSPVIVDLEDIIKIDIECELGEKIFENKNEQYMPLKIRNFFPVKN